METTQALFGFVGLGELLILLFLVPLFAFWVWMIIDCADNEKSGSTKVCWMLVILIGGCAGAPIYFLARRLPRRNGSKGNKELRNDTTGGSATGSLGHPIGKTVEPTFERGDQGDVFDSELFYRLEKTASGPSDYKNGFRFYLDGGKRVFIDSAKEFIEGASKGAEKPSENSIEVKLVRLKKLFEQGLISADDFAAKKKQLLDEI